MLMHLYPALHLVCKASVPCELTIIMCLRHTTGAAVGPLITGLLSSKEVSVVHIHYV